MNIRAVGRMAGIAIGIFLAAPAQGQGDAAKSYPSRPVRIIIPATSGSPAGLMGRAIAESLTQVLGQPMVVDERP